MHAHSLQVSIEFEDGQQLSSEEMKTTASEPMLQGKTLFTAPTERDSNTEGEDGEGEVVDNWAWCDARCNCRLCHLQRAFL